MPEKDLAKLIEDVSNSLHAEMQAMREEVRGLRAEFTESANRIETVVERHSRQITSGTLAIGAINRSISRQDRMCCEICGRAPRTSQRPAQRNQDARGR